MRRGTDAWVQTASGGQFWPFDPSPEDVSLQDVVHQLSQMTRFNGATIQPYFTAQHCLLVASLVSEEYRLAALLHEAAEPYCGDFLAPIKKYQRSMRELEQDIWERAVAPALHLPLELPEEVKHADLIALATEKRDLMIKAPAPWITDTMGILPLSRKLVFMTSEDAYMALRREVGAEYRRLGLNPRW